MSDIYKGEKHRKYKWTNWLGNHSLAVDTLWRPRSLADLVYICRQAQREGRKVHAIGGSYSLEHPGATSDWMVDLKYLNATLPGLVGPGFVADGVDPVLRRSHLGDLGPLIHVEAGARLFDLCNQWLVGQAGTVNCICHTQGRLFVTTSGNRFLTRASSDLSSGWSDIGHANDITAMVASENRLFGVHASGALSWRTPVLREVDWRFITHLGAKENYAFPTLGGFLGQTVAGAISTGTHGSDIDLPPLCDFVLAIHLVTGGGRELWVESKSQPLTTGQATLREKVRTCTGLEIIRDDHLFNALLVGLGRFGIIYSYVLKVNKAFRLAEFDPELPWSAVEAALSTRRGSLATLRGILASPPRPSGSLGRNKSDTLMLLSVRAIRPRAGLDVDGRRRTRPT